MLADYTSNPYPISRDAQRDIEPQYQSAGVDTPVPPHFLGYQDATTPPWFQPAGDPGPYGYLHGLSIQPSTYVPEGYNVFALGVGGDMNPFFAVGYADLSTHGGIIPGYIDPGNFPRCDTSPGGPVHLTTNISGAWSQVSPLYLSQEVRRYSVWKTHWY